MGQLHENDDIDPRGQVSGMTESEARAKWARMTPELRLAMAKAAPKVAGPWQRETGRRFEHLSRSCNGQGPVCGVTVADECWWYARGTPGKPARSLAQAQSACDAELIRQGYVLETSE